jgi:hypothetical protein
MPSFVGIWDTERFIDEANPLQLLELAVTEEAPNILDGRIPGGGHDMTLDGNVVLDGRFWSGTYQSPVGSGGFVFIISENGEAIAGGWSEGNVPPARAWIGKRRP